jgi:hypothetical protein
MAFTIAVDSTISEREVIAEPSRLRGPDLAVVAPTVIGATADRR